MRYRLALAAIGAITACRPYDLQTTTAGQDGLIPAIQFARYGHEQAKLVAIGRSLAQWDGGTTPEARATQVTKALEYAKTIPGVVNVVPDTLGYRLTVTFASGWRAAALPIGDGIAPEATPGVAGK